MTVCCAPRRSSLFGGYSFALGALYQQIRFRIERAIEFDENPLLLNLNLIVIVLIEIAVLLYYYY